MGICVYGLMRVGLDGKLIRFTGGINTMGVVVKPEFKLDFAEIRTMQIIIARLPHTDESVE